MEHQKIHNIAFIDGQNLYRGLDWDLDFDQKYDQALIVSGDGDFKILVDFLIERGKFAKVLAPNIKYCSSLYNKTTHLPNKYVAYISLLKDKLEYKRKKGLPKH